MTGLGHGQTHRTKLPQQAQSASANEDLWHDPGWVSRTAILSSLNELMSMDPQMHKSSKWALLVACELLWLVVTQN